MLELSERKRKHIIWTLLSIMPIVGMAVDLVAPSLPAISVDLHVGAGVTKNIVAAYLLGYALGNFLTGFLTDAWGRRKLLCVGLIAFVGVSLIPTYFPRVEIVLLARFFQGLTIGAVAVLVRASLSDIVPKDKITRLGVLIGTMWSIGPVIGPVIGGYLQFYFGWKAGFYFFAGITSIAWIMVARIVPETHFNRHPLNISTIKTNLKEVITHRLFMGVTILMGLVYSAIIGFNTVGPFLIQAKLHYSPVFFGHLALFLGLIFIISTSACRYLLKKYEAKQLIYLAIHGFWVFTLVAVITCYIFPNNIIVISIASALMYFACGSIFPLSMGLGMSLFRHIAGTATAMMYLFNILITSLVSFSLSFINVHDAILLMWLYFLLLLMGIITYWGMVHPWGTSAK